jgi:hypothetical protein
MLIQPNARTVFAWIFSICGHPVIDYEIKDEIEKTRLMIIWVPKVLLYKWWFNLEDTNTMHPSNREIYSRFFGFLLNFFLHDPPLSLLLLVKSGLEVYCVRPLHPRNREFCSRFSCFSLFTTWSQASHHPTLWTFVTSCLRGKNVLKFTALGIYRDSIAT